MSPRLTCKGTLTVAALLLSAPAFAQSIGPRPFPPPSYGAPTAPAIVGYESTIFSAHGFLFSADVSLAAVQRFVPAGYTVLASATDPARATVTGAIAIESFVTLTVPVGSFAPGTYGPYESLSLVVTTRAPSGFIEIVSLAGLANNAEIVDLLNALQGPNSWRLADILADLHEEFGQLQIKAKVQDFDFGLRLNMTLSGPAQVTAQGRAELPLPARAVDSLASPPTPNTLSSFMAKNDSGAITDPAAFTLNGRLKLSGGRLDILASRGLILYWNQESFTNVN